MRMIYFRNLISVIILITLTYVGAFFYHPQRISENWLDAKFEIIKQKDRAIDGQKIIILSGSNSVFGVDSKILQTSLDIPVLNLASHGAFDLNFYTNILSGFIDPGDLVVVPLEYSHYTRERFSDVYIQEMSLWGVKYLSWREKLNVLRHGSFPQVFSGIAGRYVINDIDSHELLELINQRDMPSRKSNQGYYRWEHLTRDGELLYDEVSTEEVAEINQRYLRVSRVSSGFLKKFRALELLVENSGAQILLTHPVTMNNPRHDLNEPETKQRVQELVTRLKENNINLYCNPEEVHLDREHFLNTAYHLNQKGATIRSVALARCIRKYISRFEEGELQ